MTVKAIGLLSGGLDSTIAVKFMKEMGIDIIAVNFSSPFCTCTQKSAGCKSQAAKVADEFGVPIKSYFLGEAYLDIIRNPKHGYGSQINPCLDCRIMMFSRTKEIMKELGASFIFTGEVLGQRPMSQRRDAMTKIDKEAGIDGLILRPLSAHHFEPTIAEINGWVDREKLLDFSGRSRKPQMELADTLEILEYQCASGGCLLTDEHFAKRLRDLFDHDKDVTLKDAKLLRYGRQFRISENCKAIVGRDEDENKKIGMYMAKHDLLLLPDETSGPTTLLKTSGAELSQEDVFKAALISAYYFKKVPVGEKVPFLVNSLDPDYKGEKKISSDKETEENIHQNLI